MWVRLYWQVRKGALNRDKLAKDSTALALLKNHDEFDWKKAFFVT